MRDLDCRANTVLSLLFGSAKVPSLRYRTLQSTRHTFGLLGTLSGEIVRLGGQVVVRITASAAFSTWFLLPRPLCLLYLNMDQIPRFLPRHQRSQENKRELCLGS